jgi:hypothetical protein
MAEALPNCTAGRSAHLSQRVEAAVRNLDKTSPVGSAPDWEALKRSARRWAKSFETLEEFNPEASRTEDEPTVFSILTSGMDETLDRLCGMESEETTEQTSQRLEQLGARITYHTMSVALISAYFER